MGDEYFRSGYSVEENGKKLSTTTYITELPLEVYKTNATTTEENLSIRSLAPGYGTVSIREDSFLWT
jgi:hypothetical protein